MAKDLTILSTPMDGKGNALPLTANSKMEEHYMKMYGDEIQVRNVVEILDKYKHSQRPP